MKHCDCANFLSLDCEKGMCALDKAIVPLDGEGSFACPRFKEGYLCKFCSNFHDPDDHGIGTCTGFEKPEWAYAGCGAFACEHFVRASELEAVSE